MKLNLITRNFILPLILACNLAACNNGNTEKGNPVNNNEGMVKPVSSYHLDIPESWTTERIFFPIDFAPQIMYTGVEDLRFTHGWEDITSEEHWCYAFLWWLDGKPEINGAVLQNDLGNYYSGLVKRNIIKRSIPAIKVVPTVATIKQTNTADGDTKTFSGTINMLDYIAQTPIVLNCLVHIKNCGAKNNTAIFFEISPKPYEHNIWQQLNKLNEDFKCGEQAYK